MLFSRKLQPIMTLATTVTLVTIVMAACSSAAPSSPSVSSSPAAPSQAAATKSAESKAPASQPSAAPSWKAEWDKTVASAKQEGKVVVTIGPGDQYRNAVMAFKNAYPEITVEATGMAGPAAGPRYLSERQAGQYLWDVYIGSPQTASTVLKRNGVLDPIRPSLLLPEVLDNSKWLSGFDEGWMDTEGKYVYAFQGLLDFFAYVNRDLVLESELNTINQLIDPKWKGKIASRDPRISGKAAMDAGELMLLKGEDWIRKLFSQNLDILSDDRQAAEALVRGSYPIGLGVPRSALEVFYTQGLGKHVVPVEGSSLGGQKWSPGFGSVSLVNKAPHPNAAKVFVNWLLSVDGQRAWVDGSRNNSRRLDVPGPPETTLNPNFKYTTFQKEDQVSKIERVYEIAKEVIK